MAYKVPKKTHQQTPLQLALTLFFGLSKNPISIVPDPSLFLTHILQCNVENDVLWWFFSFSRTNPLYEDHILHEVDENFEEERNSSTTEEEVDKSTIILELNAGTSSSSSGYSSNRVVNNNKNQHATMNNGKEIFFKLL